LPSAFYIEVELSSSCQHTCS